MTISSLDELPNRRPPALVGFGLDYNHRDRYAHGMAGLCDRYRSRLTHLSMVCLSNSEDARAFREMSGHLPRVHHLSNIAPANPQGVDWKRFDVQNRISREIDALWCGEDIGIWSFGPYDIPYFAPPPFEADVADLIGDRIAEIERKSVVPFLGEIPSCTFAAGRLELGEFFRLLVDRSGCRLVLDVSHVFSYALARGQDAQAVLASLPLEAVWECHVAGGRVSERWRSHYVDNHEDPILPEVIDLVVAATRLCPSLRCVTFEIGVGMPAEVIEASVTRLEAALGQASFIPRL
jgi:hypothetical protein